MTSGNGNGEVNCSKMYDSKVLKSCLKKIWTNFFILLQISVFFSVGVGVGFLLAKANAKKVSFGLGTALFIAKRLIDFYTRGRRREREWGEKAEEFWLNVVVVGSMLVLGKSFSWLMSVFFLCVAVVSWLDIHETVIYICTVFIFYSQINTQNNWNIHALYIA